MEPSQHPWHALPSDAKALVIRELAVSLPDLTSCLLASKETQQLAQPWVWRAYACNACGTTAFHAHDLVKAGASRWVQLTMNGHKAHKFCAALASVSHCGPECLGRLDVSGCAIELKQLAPDPERRRLLLDEHNHDVKARWQHVFCGGCQRALGLVVFSVERAGLGRGDDHLEGDALCLSLPGHYIVAEKYVHLVGPSLHEKGATRELDTATQHVFRCSGVRRTAATAAGAPHDGAAASNAGAAEAPAQQEAAGACPAAAAAPASSAERPSSSNAATPVAPAAFKPAAPVCGAALFAQRDMLNTEHTWSVDGVKLERAAFVNQLLPGSFTEEPAVKQRLMQGQMEVAHVSCSRCGGRIGWRFVKDLGSKRHNAYQVGRFGIVRSSLVGNVAVAVAFRPAWNGSIGNMPGHFHDHYTSSGDSGSSDEE